MVDLPKTRLDMVVVLALMYLPIHTLHHTHPPLL